MIQEVLNDFIGYLKKPDPFIKQKNRFIPYRDLFLLVVISLVASQILDSLVQILANLKVIPTEPKSIFNSGELSNLEIAASAILLAPPLEELIFRYQLKWLNSAYLFSIVSLIIFFSSYLTILETFILGFALIIIAMFINKKLSDSYSFKHRFIQYTFPVYFYLVALFFGLVHITNFLDIAAYGPLIVIWVLPQLFGGLVLGYTRMRYGFYSGILVHALHNGIGIGISLLITSKI